MIAPESPVPVEMPHAPLYSRFFCWISFSSATFVVPFSENLRRAGWRDHSPPSPSLPSSSVAAPPKHAS